MTFITKQLKIHPNIKIDQILLDDDSIIFESIEKYKRAKNIHNFLYNDYFEFKHYANTKSTVHIAAINTRPNEMKTLKRIPLVYISNSMVCTNDGTWN